MTVGVLYVGGMPRSGSTLTDLMLDRLPGHVSVGELFYLWRNGLQHDGLCSCGRAFSECPFWTAVGEQAYGGWAAVSAAHVMSLQDKVDTTSRIPALLSGRGSAGFRRYRDEYLDVLLRLYEGIAAVAGADVVVDSSKRPSLLYLLAQSDQVRLTVAHVLRDPRGVAYSFGKHVPLEQGAALGAEMPRSTTRKVSRRWVTVNALVGAVARRGVPVVRVRYEDLIRRPEVELCRIAVAEGLEESAVDMSFLSAEGMAVPETHVVAGGRIRLVDGILPIRLDEAWRREMTRRDRRVVSMLTLPSRLRYGYR